MVSKFSRFQSSSRVHRMRSVLKTPLFGILVAAWLLTAPAWPQSESAGLDHVLTQMDGVARNFRTTEASVVTDQYQKVIDETETQNGKIYFRREGGEIQMAADFAEPDRKYVIYRSEEHTSELQSLWHLVCRPLPVNNRMPSMSLGTRTLRASFPCTQALTPVR